mmetsp:Transcript_6358/g.9512  ORF Transcript_6358/g.9512 Transcript_6358/m.9512 type:complete len:92 (-) Transcript_6358:1434-1709(-)
MLLINVSSPWVFTGDRDAALEREIKEATAEAHKLLGIHRRTMTIDTTLANNSDMNSGSGAVPPECLMAVLESQLREKADNILREFGLLSTI